MTSIGMSDVPVLGFLGEMYLEWKVGVLTYLTSLGLQETLAENNTTSPQNKAKVLIFLRRHIHESLKYEFFLVDNPKDLWDSLNKRYGSKESFLYSKAADDWSSLRFQDYETVSDYNLDLCRITLQLGLYGVVKNEAEKLDKTFSTMHPLNMVLARGCRQMNLKTYSELVSVLIVYEQCGKLMMGSLREQTPSTATPRKRLHWETLTLSSRPS